MNIVFKFMQQAAAAEVATKHQGVPFILLLNIWREHYIFNCSSGTISHFIWMEQMKWSMRFVLYESYNNNYCAKKKFNFKST